MSTALIERIPALYLEEAHKAIASATADSRFQLSRGGFDIAAPDEHAQGSPLSGSCVATALMFIDLGPVQWQRSIGRKSRSSYAFKHIAKRWGKALGFEPYVANGDMICAALWRNLPFKRHDRRDPNCHIGLALADEDRTWRGL